MNEEEYITQIRKELADKFIEEIREAPTSLDNHTYDEEEKPQQINISPKMFSKNMQDGYNLIIKVLRKYCDLREEYYNIIALWIMGTWFHKQFVSFPYLFINAMKGSGKSRLLKLIIAMSWNGTMMNNISESVLFRTASIRTLGIDEFEHVGNKEKGVLRELLNSAYKKGTFVERVYKIKGMTKEEYKIERFNVFCPICMANIWGMDEVLSDRCISMIIEKSGNSRITKLLELFDEDDDINMIKRTFSVVSVMTNPNKVNIQKNWNVYVSDIYTTTHTTLTTQTTLTTLDEDLIKTFNQINGAGIDSRNLELFFPLFLLSKWTSEEIFQKTIETSKNMVKSKKDDDKAESKDVTLLTFLYHSHNDLIRFAESNFLYEDIILNNYKLWMGYDEKNDEFKYLNSRWIGRALKRLNLIVEKKRMAKGMMIHIDFKKAKEKAMMFDTVEVPVEKIDDAIPEIALEGTQSSKGAQ